MRKVLRSEYTWNYPKQEVIEFVYQKVFWTTLDGDIRERDHERITRRQGRLQINDRGAIMDCSRVLGESEVGLVNSEEGRGAEEAGPGRRARPGGLHSGRRPAQQGHRRLQRSSQAR